MKNKMTEEEKQDVCNTVDNEGFDYTFRHYSSFDEIKDATFHELISNYIEAADALEEYINWEKYQP